MNTRNVWASVFKVNLNTWLVTIFGRLK